MMESLGIEAEEAVEHPWVTKAIKNAQQKLREHDFWIGRQQSYLNLAFSEVQPHAKVWFEQARYFVQFDEHADDLEANLTFASIDWLIDRYIEANFLSMLNNVRDVNYDTAKTIVALINNSFASANIKLLAEGDLEGRTGEKARLMIRKWLQNVLRRKIQTATLLKSDWNKNLFEFFEESELLPKEIEKLYAKFAQENNEEPIIHESVTLDDIVHTNIVENRLLACKSKRLFMDSRLVLGAESRFG